MRKVIAIFLLILGLAELVQFFIDFDPDKQIPQYVWSLLYPAILIAAGYQLWFTSKAKKQSQARNYKPRRPSTERTSPSKPRQGTRKSSSSKSTYSSTPRSRTSSK